MRRVRRLRGDGGCSVVEEQRRVHSLVGEDGVGKPFVGCSFQCLHFSDIYIFIFFYFNLPNPLF